MLQTHHWSRPLLLIYDIIPFTLAAVWGCPYHDKLLFCHSLPAPLYPAPHLPLVATRSIAWSVHFPVTYINPNTSPKELQLSSLGYFPSLQDALLVIPTRPVITHTSRSSLPLITLIPQPDQSPVVTIEEPPIPFSPFSSADCTMLNHFSFNDFIAIAFLDIAGDLDTQI